MTNTKIVTLEMLEFLMDSCFKDFIVAVSQKKFFQHLIALLKSQSSEIQLKLLNLIEKWGLKYEHETDSLKNFFDIYSSLKNKGITFQKNDNSNNSYLKYLNKTSDKPINIKAPTKNLKKSEYFRYLDNVYLDLNKESYDDKFFQFVDELKMVSENILLTNEVLDNSDYNHKGIPENVRLVIRNLMDLSSILKL